jgi:hypothetical protein
MLLSLLPIHAANTSVMHNNDQVTGELPYLLHEKLLSSIEPHFEVWSIHHLLPLIFAFILI